MHTPSSLGISRRRKKQLVLQIMQSSGPTLLRMRRRHFRRLRHHPTPSQWPPKAMAIPTAFQPRGGANVMATVSMGPSQHVEEVSAATILPPTSPSPAIPMATKASTINQRVQAFWCFGSCDRQRLPTQCLLNRGWPSTTMAPLLQLHFPARQMLSA